MSVAIGNLRQCRVEATMDEGRIIGVSYIFSQDQRDNRAGREIVQPGRQFGAWWWWDLADVTPFKEEFAHKDRCDVHQTNRNLDFIADLYCANTHDDNPDYQRGYVWTLPDKVAYIGSVLRGMDVGKFVIVRYEWPRNRTEILDGKQRMTALGEFVTGQFQFRGRYFWDLSRMDRHHFMSTILQVGEVDGNKTTRAERLALFLDVNAAGVPQTEEHLAKVRRLHAEAVAAEAKK